MEENILLFFRLIIPIIIIVSTFISYNFFKKMKELEERLKKSIVNVDKKNENIKEMIKIVEETEEGSEIEFIE